MMRPLFHVSRSTYISDIARLTKYHLSILSLRVAVIAYSGRQPYTVASLPADYDEWHVCKDYRLTDWH